MTPEPKAAKQAMLASNNRVIGGEQDAGFVRRNEDVRVIDLQLANLPSSADMIGVKKMSGAKNVIGVALDEDNMKGICKGTGRI